MTYEASNSAAAALPAPSAQGGLVARVLRTLVLAGGLGAAGVMAAGCATTAGVYGPDLVYVSPGVQVIADYDEPIFYADGYYWRSTGGVWYRSSYYSGGWVYARPPGAILSIHNPHYYRHYRPNGWAPRGRGPGAAPVVRGGPPPHAAPPQRSFGPGFGGAPPAHAGPPGGGFRAGPSHGGGHGGPPPPAPRARAPMMGRGPHR